MASESLRQFLRAEVLLAVGPAAAPGLCWSDCQLPTLRDVSCLRPNFSTARLGVEVLFEDNSAATAFEASDGNWEGVAARLAAPRRSSVETLSSLFAYHVLPSAAHVATRSKHWRCWRGILTWAVARRCTSQVLPMERAALQGLLMDLLSLGCGASTIKGYLDCIQGRHRAHDLPSPMRGSSSYQVICRSLKRFQGRQAPYKFPIHRSLVVKLLDFEAPTLARRRDCLAAALATICCLRPSEGARLQSCDVFFDFDVASGFPGYRGTAAINVMSRKNDQDRKGHHPRIGRSRSDSLDLVHQLRRFIWRKPALSLVPAARSVCALRLAACFARLCSRCPNVEKTGMLLCRTNTHLRTHSLEWCLGRCATWAAIRARFRASVLAGAGYPRLSRLECRSPYCGCRVAMLSAAQPLACTFV